jgi:hypothetical protein
MIFVAHNNPTKVLQPRKQAFNLPASFVTPKFSAVLRFCPFPISFVRRNQFNVEFFQLFIERIRIIRFIADYLSRSLFDKTLAEGSLNQFDLVRRSRFRVDGERKTKAVCHCHELRAFAPLGFSNFEPPFLADTKVPSIKVSDKSSFPRSSKSWAKVSSTLFNLSSLTHSWNRRWQVWYGGNRSGKSAHRAPERKIQSTPFITWRSARRGLPRVATTGGLSNKGSINNHCSSVNSSRRAIREVYQTIF